MAYTMSLRSVKFPNIGCPREPRPEVPRELFARRLARVRKEMAQRELDALVVYGDREHFANLHYLTCYDPRFEESLLVILPKGRPVLLVGNEGIGYCKIARLDIEPVVYRPFSLLGQSRRGVRRLEAVLRECGISRGMRVGTAGWKYFGPDEVSDPGDALDLPEFISVPLRQSVGARGSVSNHTDLFMHPENGLRNINEPEQLADFEWIATCNSQGVLDGIRGIRAGMTEQEAYRNVGYNGLALCCHPKCLSGEHLRTYGMGSSTCRVLRRGDPVSLTLSYQGANTCRFGWLARGPMDMAPEVRDYVEVAAFPYAAALMDWYGALRTGVTGHELHHIVWDRLKALGFTLALNIGHQIAFDEWVHSPIASGSVCSIRSGMYLQADFFGRLEGPHHGAFAEDGAAVADERLRLRLAAQYPLMWTRIEARRRFMAEELGMEIDDDLLPFSNFQGAMVPYFLRPNLSVVRRTA